MTIQYDRRRGKLVGALIVELDTEVYAITSSGGVIRTLAREVRKAKRQTMGVRLMNLSEGDSLVAIARNADADDRSIDGEPAGPAPAGADRPTVRARRPDRRGVVVTAPPAPVVDAPAADPVPPAAGDGRWRPRSTSGPATRTADPAPRGRRRRARARTNARRAKATRRPPRLASLQLKRVDPWTVLKISLIVAIVMFFVWMIAVGILYLSLGSMDVWTKINETYSTLTSTPDATAGADRPDHPGAGVRHHRGHRRDQHRAVHRAGHRRRVHLQRRRRACPAGWS